MRPFSHAPHDGTDMRQHWLYGQLLGYLKLYARLNIDGFCALTNSATVA